MTDLAALAAELTNDPLARGYAAMTDVDAADSLNAKNRDLKLASMSGDEIFAQTVPSEFSTLLGNKQELWLSFCGRETVDPFAVANIEFVKFVFGATGATVANLSAARTVENGQSRAQELGLGTVFWHDVEKARA